MINERLKEITCPVCGANWWVIDVKIAEDLFSTTISCECHLCGHGWIESLPDGMAILDELNNQEYHSEDGVLGCVPKDSPKTFLRLTITYRPGGNVTYQLDQVEAIYKPACSTKELSTHVEVYTYFNNEEEFESYKSNCIPKEYHNDIIRSF